MVMVMVMVYGLWFMSEQLKLIFGGMMSRGLSPWGAGGTHFDTNMAIYTHVSSNYTHICPIIRHFRGS